MTNSLRNILPTLLLSIACAVAASATEMPSEIPLTFDLYRDLEPKPALTCKRADLVKKGSHCTQENELLSLQHEIVAAKGVQEWVVRIRNKTNIPLRLQPQLTWSLPNGHSFRSYWDGSEKIVPIEAIKEDASCDNLRTMASWTAVYGDKRGVMAGINPGQLSSFVRATFRPAGADVSAALIFATRTVIPAGSEAEIRLMFSDYPIHYGGDREIVQRIHDSFPQLFTPRADVSTAILGASSHYWMSGIPLEAIPGNAPLEVMRRLHATWEWCYAPFKRAGDHWGKPEQWDYKTLIPYSDKSSNRMSQKLDFANLPLEAFQEKREAYFNRYKGQYGFMFYTPAGAWVEKELAESKFSDAIIADPNHKCDLKYYVTGVDQELMVLPWFTSIEEDLKTDFRRISEAYDIHGFGLDVALGGPRYRGPAVTRDDAPRGYDENGVFIDLGVGMARLIEYIHTLPVRFNPEQRLAAVINGSRSFNVATRCDLAMLEGTPYFHGREMIPISRYLLGKKPATWWKGWAYTDFAVPNWQRYDQAHFIKTMQGLADYLIFSSLEWGNLPTLTCELGVPKVTRYLPLMMECSRLGWQATFPVEHDFTRNLHTGRYGEGVQTRLFWGNPFDEASEVKSKIDNRYLGRGAYAFATLVNGQETLANRISGDATAIDFQLISRQPFLMQAVAEFPHGFQGEVATKYQETPVEKTIFLDIVTSDQNRQSVRFPSFPDFRLSQVAIDGVAVPVRQAKGQYTIEAILSGKREIKLQYRSTILHFDLAALKTFPFFDAAWQPGFSVVSKQLDLLTRTGVDERIRQYFQFYPKVTEKRQVTVPVEMKASAEDWKGPVWTIALDDAAQSPGISMPTPSEIHFQARNVQELGHCIDRFLDLLDQRYPYHLGFIGTWGMNGSLLRHVKMTGKTLPE